MARAVTTKAQDDRHGGGLDRRPADLLSDPLHDHHLVQVGAGGDPGLQPDPVRHDRELRRGAGAERLLPLLPELGDPVGRLDDPGADHRHPGGLVDGVLADQAHQGHPDVDALHQDDAGGGGAVPDLPDLPRHRPAGQPHRPDGHADADQPADRGVDALHLLPRDPRRDPRGGAHGRRIAVGRDLAMC